MASKKELESKLTLEQRNAALYLVEQQLSDELGSKKTQEEIANDLGLSRMTLYRWRTQNTIFIEYMNIIASEFLKSKQSEVFKQLMKSINSSNPSVKGIELFLKLQGLLKDINVVETGNGGARSDEDIENSLKELDDLLSDDKKDE